jgi:hypothetical protein
VDAIDSDAEEGNDDRDLCDNAGQDVEDLAEPPALYGGGKVSCYSMESDRGRGGDVIPIMRDESSPDEARKRPIASRFHIYFR